MGKRDVLVENTHEKKGPFSQREGVLQYLGSMWMCHKKGPVYVNFMPISVGV